MDEADEDALSSEFAKELAKGMESLMREIAEDANGPDAASGGEDVSEEERARAFKAAWEAMLVEGMDGNLGEGGLEGLAQASSKDPAAKGKEGAAGAGGFQDKIKQAMDKMKESESKMQVCLPYMRMGMEWVV
jgi:peroxin-19